MQSADWLHVGTWAGLAHLPPGSSFSRTWHNWNGSDLGKTGMDDGKTGTDFGVPLPSGDTPEVSTRSCSTSVPGHAVQVLNPQRHQCVGMEVPAQVCSDISRVDVDWDMFCLDRHSSCVPVPFVLAVLQRCLR